MSRERWGTFSVKDHIGDYPFAADVLMYDRLIIPYPVGDQERTRWSSAGWNPDRLDQLLEVLRADQPGGRAITVPWTQYTEELFVKRVGTVAAANIELDTNYQESRYLLLDTELLPKSAPGELPVTAVAVAAYQSGTEAAHDWIAYNEAERKERLTAALAHSFLVPDPCGRDYIEMLKDAVALSDDSDFKKKRAKVYRWQDDVLREGLNEKEALLEIEQYVIEYNLAVNAAKGAVFTKFAFTLIPIALTVLGGPLGALAAASSIGSLTKFWVTTQPPLDTILLFYPRRPADSELFFLSRESFGYRL